ncbi:MULTISPECIES: ComF family protein [unclassified Pseudomonas]|uniref:ComF family protein n=1 Tax=unclassified Pseudomonas TaxID=196821 RepID=UPI002AC9F034|nr:MULTISPECIES: ComF family protein [unclassified Pseudomonas]MEB0048042.1 ComF family protein [Pseudomonas sp. Dout3]MEB0099116.1 ComF family protein [Pseudomonas sp. DC1.2]WPX58459.1 ComF family protein [Pseudomonas sp. DC1.2]
MRCQPRYEGPVYIWLKNKQICLLCSEPCDFATPICTACETELPWLRNHCQCCALPLPNSGLTCGQCLRQPPAFERVIAPWTYSFPIDTLITRFKHSAKWPFGNLLGELLVQFLHHRFDEDLERPDALIPVPLATKRLRQRGFNQAAMLARWLSEGLSIPCDENLLLRIQDTSAQQELNAQARQRNLRNAFALKSDVPVAGRHLALIDDVLTTGATAQTVARLLMDAGAARVDVYCLARTPKPGDTV